MDISSETVGVGSAKQWEVGGENGGERETLSFRSHPAVPRAINSCYQVAGLLISFT